MVGRSCRSGEAIMIFRVDDAGVPLDEARLWMAFAKRFLLPNAYRYGASLVLLLGAEGALAVAATLRRIRSQAAGHEEFACGEAANILTGEAEAFRSDMSH
jgi:hypothetical protein